MGITLLFACFCFAQAQQNARNWLKRYNIDPTNSNPVFTRPMHENAESRVEGAGINMNDGEAYNRTYYNFGGEWHYEPKLPLCKEEEAVLSRITGDYFYEDNHTHIATVGEILKYGVIPTEFGAVVAYRIWGRDSDQPIRHYYATFNHNGTLIDAFYVGESGWQSAILKAEPHGNYEVKSNLGGGNMQFSKDGKTLTRVGYFYYNVPEQRSGVKWEDTLVYNISSEGIFSIEYHSQSGKPEINQAAEKLFSLETLPLSNKDAIKKWNAFVKEHKDNEQLAPRISEGVLRLFISRQQEFMEWTTANKNESVLITALRPGFKSLAELYGSGTVQMLVIDGIENCPDKVVRTYWQNLKTIRSLSDL